MSNKDINTNEDFDNIIRGKLDDYQLPVDADAWDTISHGLIHRKRYMFIRRSLSIAAAIAVMIFIAINYQSDKQGIELGHITISDINKENRVVKAKPEVNIASTACIIHNQSLKTSKTNGKIPTGGINVTKVVTKANTNNIIDSIINLPNYEPAIDIAQIQGTAGENADSIRNNQNDILLKKEHDDILYTDDIIPLLDKPKNKWTLLASFNSVGSANDTRTANHLAGVLSNNYNDRIAALSQSSITDVDYDAPIAFSLMAGKRINSFLSIETGLSYTRLNTKFREMNGFSTSELELHYIGIPVNALIDVWNISPRLRLYAGGGFAAEKGIRAKSRHFYNQSGQSTITKEKISGLQWSLNASVGISYRLVGNFNLYAEPKLYYYFDNNQPLSIRTEKKTVIGFNSGIRFEF